MLFAHCSLSGPSNPSPTHNDAATGDQAPYSASRSRTTHPPTLRENDNKRQNDTGTFATRLSFEEIRQLGQLRERLAPAAWAARRTSSCWLLLRPKTCHRGKSVLGAPIRSACLRGSLSAPSTSNHKHSNASTGKGVPPGVRESLSGRWVGGWVGRVVHEGCVQEGFASDSFCWLNSKQKRLA